MENDATMNDRIEETKRIIERAFDEVEYPSGKPVVSAADGPALVERFTNERWQDLTPEMLTYSSLYFFTAEGFQYFLPAFLLTSLDEENVELRGRVVRALAPHTPGDAAQEAAFLERIRLLSPVQRAAVRAFLEVVNATYADEFRRSPAALARDGYWLREDSSERRS